MKKNLFFLGLSFLLLTGIVNAQTKSNLQEKKMKTLVLYYSYTGNTKSIAQEVQKKLNCNIAEIVPVVSYSTDYDTVVDQAHVDVNKEYKPEVKPLGVNISDYDVIVIGSPVWWYHVASPVLTVLHLNDWSGKSVYTFATNAGWIGKTFDDFEKEMKGASIKSKMNIIFDNGKLKTSQSKIDEWINSIK